MAERLPDLPEKLDAGAKPARSGPTPVPAAAAPERPPILSVIDVGASGIRMLIAELSPDGSVRTLEELERPIALGRDTFQTGSLSVASIRKAVNVLRQYRAVMDTYGVQHTRAVATSAVRGALNRDTFVDRVFLATGIELEVIEGSQESLLTFAAVQRYMEAHPEYREGEALLLSLGGGATEWALVRNGQVAASITHDMGTLRMREVLRTDTGDRRARARLLQHNAREMMNVVKRALPFEHVTRLVAVGSEARFAARVLAGKESEAQDLTAIAAKDLKKLADQILPLTPEQIAQAYSVAPNETELLAPALFAYAELTRLNQVDQLLVARASMREGLILHMVRSIRSGSTVLFPDQTIAAAVNLARKYGADEKHGLQTATLARAIFQATFSQHQMGEREQLLLEVASIVHDIGEFVASRGHHRHTYYLLVHSEVFGLSQMDLEIVANIARYHRRGVPQADHPSYASLPRPARLAVNRLSAILRVADALDKSHSQRVLDPKITVSGDELRIQVDSTEDLGLERMSLDAKSGLFEEVFGLKPVIVEGMTA
ncbi:MAG TPA: Ppx/GppA phosphatase family protein [Candidatus Binatia bacterium]|nr:Ppx/GppA phosphatase family protein [Candidatus Binatia bacterium]